VFDSVIKWNLFSLSDSVIKAEQPLNVRNLPWSSNQKSPCSLTARKELIGPADILREFIDTYPHQSACTLSGTYAAVNQGTHFQSVVKHNIHGPF